MKKLIVVPTLHDVAEAHPVYGVPAQALPQGNILDKVSHMMWQSIETTIARSSAEIPHWKVFAEGVISLTPHPPNLFLYQEARKQAEESYPVQSRQNTLLTALWLAGATFIPTDDPLAYAKTFEAWSAYQQLDEHMKSLELDAKVDEKTRKESQQLLRKITMLGKQRDRHVGEIISNNLQEDETGILIFGALHNSIRYLPPSISVSFITEETQAFWNLLQDPQIDSLYDAARLFLEDRKGKGQWI